MALEEPLEPAMDFRAGFFLVPEQGRDLPVAEPFATLADDEAVIRT